MSRFHLGLTVLGRGAACLALSLLLASGTIPAKADPIGLGSMPPGS